MLVEAELALSFVAAHTRESLATNPQALRAVLYCMTIIGEAATHIPPPVRDRAPDIPWRQVVGMRNWLVHDYVRTDLRVVWDTVTDNLPGFVVSIRQLRDQLLAEQPPPSENP